MLKLLFNHDVLEVKISVIHLSAAKNCGAPKLVWYALPTYDTYLAVRLDK